MKGFTSFFVNRSIQTVASSNYIYTTKMRFPSAENVMAVAIGQIGKELEPSLVSFPDIFEVVQKSTLNELTVLWHAVPEYNDLLKLGDKLSSWMNLYSLKILIWYCEREMGLKDGSVRLTKPVDVEKNSFYDLMTSIEETMKDPNNFVESVEEKDYEEE